MKNSIRLLILALVVLLGVVLYTTLRSPEAAPCSSCVPYSPYTPYVTPAPVQVNEEMRRIIAETNALGEQEIKLAEIVAEVARETGQSETDILRKIQDADAYNARTPTTAERYKTSAGVYTDERSALHKKILEETFAGKDTAKAQQGERPRVIMLGGRGGAGKSQFEGMVYTQDEYLLLNSDEFKKLLPEYKGYNANEVHRESGDLLAMAEKLAVAHRYHVVIDATMSGRKSTQAKIEMFQKAGYQIDMYFMHLPCKISTMRGIKRFVSKPNGRYVPFVVLTDMTACEQNFYDLLPYATNWAFFTNLGGYKTGPKFIDGNKNPLVEKPRP